MRIHTVHQVLLGHVVAVAALFRLQHDSFDVQNIPKVVVKGVILISCDIVDAAQPNRIVFVPTSAPAASTSSARCAG